MTKIESIRYIYFLNTILFPNEVMVGSTKNCEGFASLFGKVFTLKELEENSSRIDDMEGCLW